MLASETATVTEDAPGNIPTSRWRRHGDGFGRFITFTPGQNGELQPNTTYGFDVSGGTDRHYLAMDGPAMTLWAGAAYSCCKGKMAERGRHCCSCHYAG